MKKRILFVLHLPPPVHGASMMGSFLKDSRVIGDAFDCRFINLATSSGLQEIGRLSFRKITSFLALLRSVLRAKRQWHPDLVYLTPTSRFPAFVKDYLVVVLCKMLGMRVILHFHNTGVSRAERRFQKRMYRHFFSNTRVILLSERLYPDIAAYVSRDRVDICPNGLPDLFHGIPPKREVSEEVRILFLSNLLIDKGIYVFLDACRRLRDAGIPFSGRIVGGETAEVDAERLSEAISERGLDHVSYLGRLSGEDKRKVLETSDILAFPSMDEAFGLVLLEAQQACLPVVATRVGSIPDIVRDGENGLLVESGRADELADALATLIARPSLRERMGEDGRRTWEACFSLPAFENRMLVILSRAVGQ